MLDDLDQKFLDIAITEAESWRDVGGIPIGSSPRRNEELIGCGCNQRVQKKQPDDPCRDRLYA